MPLTVRELAPVELTAPYSEPTHSSCAIASVIAPPRLEYMAEGAREPAKVALSILTFFCTVLSNESNGVKQLHSNEAMAKKRC